MASSSFTEETSTITSNVTTEPMHTQKKDMCERGDPTDEKDLRYLKWRENEQKNPSSKIFKKHSQNNRVEKAYTIRSKSMYTPPHTSTRMKRGDLMALMFEMLPTHNIKASLNTSMQHIFSNEHPITPTQIHSTDRRKTKYGVVSHYIQHDGELYVCIRNENTNFYYDFPEEFIEYTDYIDPVTKQHFGNPKIKSQYNVMNSFRGEIRVEITLRGVILDVDVTEGEDAQSLESVKKHIIDLENPIDDSAEAVPVKIKPRHDAKKAEGEQPATVVARKVKDKTSTVGPMSITEKLIQLSVLHKNGILTDDEFTAAKAKAIAE